MLEPGDDVLVERPGYDPLLGAARMFGARTTAVRATFETASRSIPAASLPR